MRLRRGWIGALFAASVLAGWVSACEDDPHDLDYLDAGDQEHDAGGQDDDDAG